MTIHRITILPDGTHVYSNGTKYRPVSMEKRQRGVNKPDLAGAVMYKGEWVLPLDVLADEDRGPVPPTRPDTEAYEHMTKRQKCKCDVCRRPESEVWKERYRAGKGPGRVRF